MKFAICNEMFQDRPLEETCATVRQLGYHGIEIAPFTIEDDARDITPKQRKETRAVIENAGLEVVGLHWLFAGPEGLHLTSQDAAVWRDTRDYLRALVDLCDDLGGNVMVLGSPKQRNIAEGQTVEDARQRASEAIRSVLDHAGDCDVTLCLEPLAPNETNFINTVSEGMRMVREIAHPCFKIHLDIKAMSSEETEIPELIRSVAVKDIGHFHVNDPNLYGPGMGEVDYEPITDAIREIGWDSWLSVEPFKYDPDPETVARKSIDCLKRFW